MNDLKNFEHMMFQELKAAQEQEKMMNLIMIVITIVVIIMIIDGIHAINDIVKSEFKNPNDKILWTLIVFLLGPIGTFMYRTKGVEQKKEQAETIDMFIKRQEETNSKDKWF